MATYTVTAPDGRKLNLTGDSPPTEAELEEIFASAGGVAVQEEVETASSLPNWVQQGLRGPMGSSVISPENISRTTGVGADMGLEAGGAALGQVVGAHGGPFAPVTVPIGGAIGGFIGNSLAQIRRGGDYSFGEALGAGAAGAVPGASVANAPARTMLREAGKGAFGNLAATTTESVVEGRGAPELLEAGVSFAGGAASPFLGKFMDTGATAQRAAERQIQNTVRDATLARARAAGYVIPSSKVNPTAPNNLIESFAGKAATGQEAAVRNQEITNSLARKAVGLPGDAPITEQVLLDVRSEAAAPYREIAAMGKAAAADLDALKQARWDAKDSWKSYDRTSDPSMRKQAQKLDAEVEKLEQKIEDRAMLAGREELVDELKKARVRIAKTYEVEKALNLGTGDVEAPRLARSIGRLTEELDTIARFQKAFPQYARPGASVPPAGVSKLRAFTPLFYGAAGYAGAGPAGLAAAAIPLLEGPARSLLLSSPYQRYMGQPFYGRGGPDFSAEIARLGLMSATRPSSIFDTPPAPRRENN